jgi:hypothetical protein
MNYTSSLKSLIAFSLFALLFSCGGETAGVTTSQEGSIAGTTVTTNNLSKSGDDFSGPSFAYLFSSDDLSNLTPLDSCEISPSGNFIFENLKSGYYDVIIKGDSKGGSRKNIEVLPGKTTEITIIINIYITQVFTIDSSITNIYLLNGVVHFDEGNQVELSTSSGDTTIALIERNENGKLDTIYIKVYVNESDSLTLINDTASDTPITPYKPRKPKPITSGIVNYKTPVLMAKYDFTDDDSKIFTDNSPSALFSGEQLSAKGLEQNIEGLSFSKEAQYSLSMPTLDSILDLRNFSIQTKILISQYPDGVINREGAILGATHWLLGQETYGYELRINKNGEVEAVFGQPDLYKWTVVKSKKSLNLNEWYSISVHYNNGTVSLWIDDDAPVIVNDVPPIQSVYLPFDIGYRSTATPRNQFIGSIEYISVYQGGLPIVDTTDLDTTVTDTTVTDTTVIDTTVIDTTASDTTASDTTASDTKTIVSYNFSSIVGDSILDNGAYKNHSLITNSEGTFFSMDGLIFEPSMQPIIQSPTIDSLLDTNNLQILATIKPHNYPALEGVICGNLSWSTSETFGFELRITSNGSIQAVLGQKNSRNYTVLTSNTTVALNEWHTIEVLLTQDTLSLFINDTLSNSMAVDHALHLKQNPLDIGYRQTGTPSNTFSGTLKSIEILIP